MGLSSFNFSWWAPKACDQRRKDKGNDYTEGDNIDIIMDGDVLQQVDRFQYLGAIITI